MFLFDFIFTSLITHIGFLVIENECSSLRFLLFKQGTPGAVSSQVPSAKICRRTSASRPELVRQVFSATALKLSSKGEPRRRNASR